jgi:hypothetical protein
MQHKKHASIDKAIQTSTHTLAGNKAFPTEDFDKIIAEERFQDIIERMQLYVHDKHDVNNMRELQMLLLEVYTDIQETEAEFRTELEELAKDLIMEDLGLEIKLLKHGEVDMGDLDEADKKEVKEIPELDLEVQKRKFVNSLIHGAAVKTTYAYHLITDELEVIKPGLTDMYSILSLMSEYGYWVVPDEMGGSETSVGKAKVDFSDDKPKVIVTATS